MKAPIGLNAAGKRAYDRALAALPDNAGERMIDAAERFAWAVHVEEVALRKWIKAGQPIIVEHSTGVVSEHPMLKALGHAQALAARLGSLLGLDPASAKRRGGVTGRPPGAVSAPDRTAEPPRIRRVK